MSPAPVNALDLREKLVTVEQAVAMIPMANVGTLVDWLSRHKAQFPARRMPWGRRYARMLTLTEVAMIRSMRLEQGERARRRRPR